VGHWRGLTSGPVRTIFSAVEPLTLDDVGGRFVLQLVAGTTPVDDVIEELGHEPNGHFWGSVAEYVMQTDAPELGDLLDLNPEGDTFVAYAAERDVLENLGSRLSAVANDPERVRALVSAAEAEGFAFDD